MKHLFFLVLLTQFIIAHTSLSETRLLSDILWEETISYHLKALDSNLISGMKKKCLDPSEFSGYLVDDTAYVNYGSKSLEIAANRSDDEALKDYMKTNAALWYEYWESMKNTVHVANIKGIAMGDAVTNYVNHIRYVAQDESLQPVYTLLALTPCARLWPWLGKQIGSGTKNFGVYTSWVEGNLDPHDTVYKEFEKRFNLAFSQGDITINNALRIYSKSMKYEVEFFNSVIRCELAETGTSTCNL